MASKRLLLTLALVLVASVASAQVPSPTPPNFRLAWDHDGINTDGYSLSIDGARTLITPVCTGTAPRICEIPFPALTPGTHAIVIGAFNEAGEAVSAPALSLSVFVKPSDPTNVRIIIREVGGG